MIYGMNNDTNVGSEVDDDTTHDVVLVHRGLSQRAKQAVPDSPVIIFDMFLGDMRIAQLVNEVQNGLEISDD